MTVLPSSAALKPPKKPRDVRLDFFRGVCLIIIYIAHIWDNPWASFIPARFGFSDATEIFVFCSGMASSAAFGAVFVQRGVWMGAVRIAHRCWQVYWSHIGTFLAVVALMVGAEKLLHAEGMYVAGLGLDQALGAHAGSALLGLMTLTFVPNFFDILPMYLVILAMLPFVMALAASDKRMLTLALLVLWAIAGTGLLDLPAEPWSVGTANAKTWFFNPFSWQIVFFTGFAFMRGWIAPPPVDARLIGLSAAVLLLALPLSWQPALDASETLTAWNVALTPLIDKTHFGVLRYAHFLSLAYLAYVAGGENGYRIRGAVADALRRVGQQSLAVFMSGLVLSFVASIVLNVIGRGVVAVAVVNLGGIGVLFGVARVVAWFKSSPWSGDGGMKAGRTVVAKPTNAEPMNAESQKADQAKPRSLSENSVSVST